MSPKKKGKSRKATKPSPKKIARSAIYEHSPATVALAEMFAVVDDVLTEEDAFSPEHIKQSLGRIYRQWLDTREAIDPDFNRERYRHQMKKRASSTGSSTRARIKSGTSDRLEPLFIRDTATTQSQAPSGKKKGRARDDG